MTKHKTWQDLLPEATAVVQEWHTRPPTNVEMYLFNQKSKESPKMKISDLYESRFLKASDLKGKEVRVIVAQVTLEAFKDDADPKPIITFQGKEKGMVLNKTNALRLSEAFGDDTEGWRGKEIMLYSEKVMFQGQETMGLRVRVPQDLVADDEIPF